LLEACAKLPVKEYLQLGEMVAEALKAKGATELINDVISGFH